VGELALDGAVGGERIRRGAALDSARHAAEFSESEPVSFLAHAGTPMLLRAWRHSAFAAVAFIATFFLCLVEARSRSR